MDHWVYDTFTLYDHDYRNSDYIQILSKKNYRIFGNWACLYGEDLQSPLDATTRLIILGGSTTSALLESTWTYHFYHQLLGTIPSLAVFNGGCGNYNSFCEFMKLNRDISTIKPTHVISLSGVNDTVLAPILSNGFASFLVKPLTQGQLFSRFNDEIPIVKRSMRWIEESVHMKSICSNYNSHFMRFLQPCLASPSNPVETMSPQLLKMMSSVRKVFSADYDQLVSQFYSDVQSSSLPTFVDDISHVLPNDDSLWRDSRHPTDQGYMIIAKEVLEKIKPALL